MFVARAERRSGSELQRVLKRLQGTGVILFADVNDAEQVVGFGVRWISLQLFLDFALGVRDATILE